MKRFRGESTHKDGVLISINKSEVGDTIQENKQQLQEKLNEAVNPNAKQHLYAVVKAAEFLMDQLSVHKKLANTIHTIRTLIML